MAGGSGSAGICPGSSVDEEELKCSSNSAAEAEEKEQFAHRKTLNGEREEDEVEEEEVPAAKVAWIRWQTVVTSEILGKRDC